MVLGSWTRESIALPLFGDPPRWRRVRAGYGLRRLRGPGEAWRTAGLAGGAAAAGLAAGLLLNNPQALTGAGHWLARLGPPAQETIIYIVPTEVPGGAAPRQPGGTAVGPRSSEPGEPLGAGAAELSRGASPGGPAAELSRDPSPLAPAAEAARGPSPAAPAAAGEPAPALPASAAEPAAAPAGEAPPAIVTPAGRAPAPTPQAAATPVPARTAAAAESRAAPAGAAPAPTPRAAATPAPARSAAAGPSHVVRKGETLTSIAQRYGTTIEAIGRANGLASVHQITEGDKLLIPR